MATTTVPATSLSEASPLWVPVMVAVIATVGTIVVAFITNRSRQAARAAEAQLTPNGNKSIAEGGTVADAINRIEQHTVLSRESIVLLNRRMTRQEARLSEVTGEVRKIVQTVAHDPDTRTRATDEGEPNV